MRVSDLVKDLIFLVGSVECFAQVGPPRSPTAPRPRRAPSALPSRPPPSPVALPRAAGPVGGLVSRRAPPGSHPGLAAAPGGVSAAGPGPGGLQGREEAPPRTHIASSSTRKRLREVPEVFWGEQLGQLSHFEGPKAAGCSVASKVLSWRGGHWVLHTPGLRSWLLL